MRKQDRVRQQPDRPDEKDQNQQMSQQEPIKGSASASEQMPKPPRQAGKLPLPD
jgi:hypothetical protein